MTKIWAKIISKEKIVKDYVYENNEPFNVKHFPLYMIDICEHFDIEVPVIISKHIKNYYLFNSTTFDITDFISESSFDRLVLENANH